MMGNMLRDRDQQYIAHRDEATHTWRILDSWHETLSGYEVDDDVPDDSPAIKILTEGEFIVLIREAARIGILENANLDNKPTESGDFNIIAEEHGVEIEKIEAELVQYKEQIRDLERQNQSLTTKIQRSEGFELKEMAMNSILKLTAMADVNNLSKD
jgi:hypothetical protein